MLAARVHDGGELRVEEASDPVAGPGEVVVELRAAALNRRDLLVRNPPGPAYDFAKPFVAGHDGAGVRRDTGEEVVVYPTVGWGAGDDVPQGGKFIGGPLDGTVRELAADGVDVALDSVGSTWQDSLRTLRKGGRLVVFGGTGGATVEVDVRFLYLNYLSILGTTGASPRQFGAFLEMAQEGSWSP